MISKFNNFLLIIIFIVTVDCGTSKIIIKDISGPPPIIGEEINGIPMVLADRQQVTVFVKQSDGKYKQVHSLIYSMPDQSRFLAARIDSKPLTNHTLSLAFNDDGTPKTVGMTTSSQGQAALSQLGSSVSAITNSAATLNQQFQKAEQASLQKKQDLEKALLSAAANRESSILTYRKALEAVIVEQAKIDGLPPETKPADRVAEESNLRVLKLEANQAARALGEKTPYPEADILP